MADPDARPDFGELRRLAADAAANAYAPYSGLQVGAAALVDDGRVITGCNVENASFGLSLCAECNLVGALHAGGGGRLVALVAAGVDGTILAPCGRCRQILQEAGGAALLVDIGNGPQPLAELLPGAFDAPDLPTPPPGASSARPGEG